MIISTQFLLHKAYTRPQNYHKKFSILAPTQNTRDKLWYFLQESWARIELAHRGFADPCVTTSPPGRCHYFIIFACNHQASCVMMASSCPGGGIGRHEGLKIPC